MKHKSSIWSTVKANSLIIIQWFLKAPGSLLRNNNLWFGIKEKLWEWPVTTVRNRRYPGPASPLNGGHAQTLQEKSTARRLQTIAPKPQSLKGGWLILVGHNQKEQKWIQETDLCRGRKIWYKGGREVLYICEVCVCVYINLQTN